jgi:hypothetical protein
VFIIGVSSNGRTRVFGTRYPGSNPGTPANKIINLPAVLLIWCTISRCNLVQVIGSFTHFIVNYIRQYNSAPD